MNNPITIEAEYTNKETSEGIIIQYAKVINKIDEGDVEGAQEMTDMLSSVQPDFKYFDELKLDIEEIKKQVKENTEDISTLKKSGGRVVGANTYMEFKNNFLNPLTSKQELYEILNDLGSSFEKEAIKDISQICMIPAMLFSSLNENYLQNILDEGISISKNNENSRLENLYWVNRVNAAILYIKPNYFEDNLINNLLDKYNNLLVLNNLSQLELDVNRLNFISFYIMKSNSLNNTKKILFIRYISYLEDFELRYDFINESMKNLAYEIKNDETKIFEFVSWMTKYFFNNLESKVLLEEFPLSTSWALNKSTESFVDFKQNIFD